MNLRRALGGLVIVAVLGCAPLPGASSSPPPSAVAATPTAPVGTSSPTAAAVTPGPSSSAALTGWWGTDGTSFCAAPAFYRTEIEVAGIGSCTGVLVDPPRTITIGVTQALDLHMTIQPSSGQPFYALPASPDATVLAPTAIADQATAGWRGAAVGTVTLTTVGACIATATQVQARRPCPVLVVQVVPLAFRGVVDLRPEGWSFLTNFPEVPDFPATSAEVYGPSGAETPPLEGPGRLVLYETFELETEDAEAYFAHRAEQSRTGGGHEVDVEVNGEPAVAWVDDESGELVLGWQLPGKSEVLVANRADFTIKQLVASAESVSECCG
ncbi:MAG TPA: hypothetical protein VM451_06220 [Candidatus Limnocylindria bacterium]|nr:hypothetical protein [Candidatus Limnocylindria bacterium]